MLSLFVCCVNNEKKSTLNPPSPCSDTATLPRQPRLVDCCQVFKHYKALLPEVATTDYLVK